MEIGGEAGSQDSSNISKYVKCRFNVKIDDDLVLSVYIDVGDEVCRGVYINQK